MMSEKEQVWFGLYYDEDCTRMLPQQLVDGRLAWVLDFGHLDAGEEKTSEFYIRNVSETTIEDLNIVFVPPMVEGVTAEVVSETFVPEVESDDVHQVKVRWMASSIVVAGRCHGTVKISAMAVEETRRYRE